MADLNSMIAQGAQFQAPMDPFAQYGKMQQLESGMRANQLHQLQLQEAQSSAQEKNALRQLNPNAPDYEAQLFKVNPTIGIAYRKEASAAAAQQASAEEQRVKSAVARQGILNQAYRDISSRPSDANVTAHMEDVLDSPLFRPEEKTAVQKLAQTLLGMPFEERGAFLSSRGATAGDLSTATTAAAGQAVTKRGQDLTAGTAVRGQDITARGQDIGASTAAAGQGVTMRGQDLTASTAEAGRLTTQRGQDIVANTAAAGQNVTKRGQDIVAGTATAGQDVTKRGQDIVANTAANRLKLEQEKFAWEKANPGYSIQDTSEGMVAVNLKNPSDVVQLKLGNTGIVSSTVRTAEQDRASRELIASASRLSTAQTADNRLAFEKTKFAWEKANPGYSIQESSAGLVAVNLKNPNDVRPLNSGGQPIGPKPIFNAAAGGFITPPVAGGAPGFTPIPQINDTRDQQAAVKALRSAGYDPITGEDTISALIKKSTSGKLQAGAAAALAFLGQTTDGRKAIAALEGTANQIATDLAGGKLGAGISNTDRDFIVSALGDVANAYKTSEERLAGWQAAKNRMVSTGLLPTPGRPAPAGGSSIHDQADAILRGSK